MNNNLLHPDAKLFDESAGEALLEAYPGQDFLTFDDDLTDRFHQDVTRITNEKFAGLRESLTLFCDHNGVASVLHSPLRLRSFLYTEAYRELFSGADIKDVFDADEERRLSRLALERVDAKLAGTASSKVLDNLRRWEKEGAL